MKEKDRDSGIAIVGDVSWGTHFCQFYKTKADMLDILVPYFKAGLENNEFCMWITCEPLNAEEAKRSLKRQVKGLDNYIKKGQIEILDYNDWYTKSGKFESDRVLQSWVEKEKQAIKNGFNGLRLTGNTFWLKKNDWKVFAEYEEVVNNVIGKYRMLAICTYSLDKCDSAEVIDVVSNHQFAIIKREGEWKRIEGSTKKKVEEKLFVSEQRFQVAIENMLDCFGIYTAVRDKLGRITDFRIEYVNEAACKNNLMGREGQIGKRLLELLPSHRESGLFDKYCQVIETGEPLSEEMFSYEDIYKQQCIKRAFDIRVTKLGDGFVASWRDITERKKAEEQIQDLAKFLSENPNPVLRVTKDGEILYSNESGQGLLAKWKTEVGGEVPQHWHNLITESLKSGEQGGQSEEEEVKDRVYSIIIASVKDTEYVNLYARDITERKKAEKELESIFNLSPDMIAICTTEGGLIKVNPSWERILGYTTDEILELGWGELVHPDDVECTNSEVEKQLKGNIVEYFVNRFRCKDGTYKTLEWQATSFIDGVVYATARDITERKKAEEERKGLNNELIQKNKELEQIIYAVSHDLRTPLVNVKGYTKELEYSLKDLMDAFKDVNIPGAVKKKIGPLFREDIPDAMRYINSGTLRMGQLLGGLSSLSRLGYNAVHAAGLDMNKIIANIVNNFEFKIREDKVEIDVTDLPCCRGDNMMVNTVFSNLIDNALKYLDSNRPGIIKISGHKEGNQSLYVIEDNGVGIDPKYKDKIFRIFHQLNPEESQGEGLGLAIVKWSLNRMRGKIWVESEPNKGSKFFVSLPSV